MLYLSIGQPRAGVGEETPEGHIARFDDGGELIGVTILRARSLVDAGAPIQVTLPQRSEILAGELAPALSAR